MRGIIATCVSVFINLSAFAPSLFAQGPNGTICGVVTIRGGAGVHDATVVLLPLKRSVQTANDGSFTFSNIPPGSYQILAHQAAFTDQTRAVTLVKAGETVDVQIPLNFAPVRQQVTVTASGTEESTLETFSSVTTLDGHQLSTRNTAPSLGELLDHEPGVAKRSYGPGTSRPVIRGFDGDRVLILQDGTRTGTLSSQSGDHGEPVDGSAIERVEIVRGPATLLYGSNAIGGVVNVITRHHELEQHPHPGVRGHLSALGGSNNGLGGGSGGFEFGYKDWLFWAEGGGQRTGNYHTKLGEIQNSFANMVQTSAGCGHYAPKNFFTLSYGVQDGKYGVPPFAEPGQQPTANGEPPVSIDWRRQNVRFNGGWRALDGWLDGFRATVNYSDWRHFELEGDELGTRFSNRQWTWQGLFQQAKRGACQAASVCGLFAAASRRQARKRSLRRLIRTRLLHSVWRSSPSNE